MDNDVRKGRELWREYHHLMRLAFPEMARKRARRYRAAHLEEDRARVRAYARTRNGRAHRLAALRHSAKGAAYYVRRRALKHGATCGDPIAIAKVYKRAKELRQWFDVVVDHIIPLVRGGAHSPENLQIIYRFENESKGTRLDYKPRVIFT